MTETTYKHPYTGKDIGQGRICSQCNKLLSWEHFTKNKYSVRYGMRSYCRPCSKLMYQANTARRKAELEEIST